MSTSTDAIPQSASPRGHATLQPDTLRDFIGLRSEPYLSHYAQLIGDGGGAKSVRPGQRLPFAASWLWPAFVLTVPWLFYRKMYTGGIILVALPILLDHVLPGSLFLGSGFLIALTAGLCGKSWYLDHAAQRLAKAHRLYPSDTIRSVYLKRAGGVSAAAGVFGVTIQCVTATVIVLDLLPPAHF